MQIDEQLAGELHDCSRLAICSVDHYACKVIDYEYNACSVVIMFDPKKFFQASNYNLAQNVNEQPEIYLKMWMCAGYVYALIGNSTKKNILIYCQSSKTQNVQFLTKLNDFMQTFGSTTVANSLPIQRNGNPKLTLNTHFLRQ